MGRMKLGVAVLAAAVISVGGCKSDSRPIVCGDGYCDPEESFIICGTDCPMCVGDVEDGICDEEYGETRATCSADCPLCDGDGECEFLLGEDGVNCPGDCLPAGCSLETITPQNAPRDYLLSSFRVPTSSSESRDVGVDLDGDGDIDNKLGEVVSLFASQADPNTFINSDIAEGRMVLAARVYIDSFPDDDMVIAQLFEGIPLADPPTFDGNDVVRIALDYPRDLYLCGNVAGGDMSTGPGTMMIPLPLPGVDTVFVTVHMTRIEGAITTQGWTDVMLGGGITGAELDSVVIPAVADYLNLVIEGDPESETASTLLGFFDGQCTDLVDDCDLAIPGEGDCEYNDPVTDPGPWITETEVRCSLLFDSAMQADVDSDGDDEPDLISVGIRVDAVQATIND